MRGVQPFPCEAEQGQKMGWVRTGVPWVDSKVIFAHIMESKFGIGLRSFGFSSGAAVIVGTRHLGQGECAGKLNLDLEDNSICSFPWFSWFPPPETSASGGWDRQCRVWTDFSVSSALLLVISAEDTEIHLEACCAKTAWWLSVESEDSNLGWSSLHLIFKVSKNEKFTEHFCPGSWGSQQ